MLFRSIGPFTHKLYRAQSKFKQNDHVSGSYLHANSLLFYFVVYIYIHIRFTERSWHSHHDLHESASADPHCVTAGRNGSPLCPGYYSFCGSLASHARTEPESLRLQAKPLLLSVSFVLPQLYSYTALFMFICSAWRQAEPLALLQEQLNKRPHSRKYCWETQS